MGEIVCQLYSAQPKDELDAQHVNILVFLYKGSDIAIYLLIVTGMNLSENFQNCKFMYGSELFSCCSFWGWVL
jgi:hypothetical protein